MTVMLPSTVAAVIDEVRREDRRLILDRFHAQVIANAHGHDDAVRWIESHYWEYGDAVLHGYEVEGDIITANDPSSRR